jgi:hypothetical protein
MAMVLQLYWDLTPAFGVYNRGKNDGGSGINQNKNTSGPTPRRRTIGAEISYAPAPAAIKAAIPRFTSISRSTITT